jgi:hypothetical protein
LLLGGAGTNILNGGGGFDTASTITTANAAISPWRMTNGGFPVSASGTSATGATT